MTNQIDDIQSTPAVFSDSQPKGLYLLFFTEMWERFGFYTLQAIIILFMTKALLMPDSHANLLYAAFSSLLYLTPTIGGYLADKYLGFQRAITIGGVLLIIGYLTCALTNDVTFFIGLGIIICANGLFKPNVSTIVGELYRKNDPRLDGGFTIFYMGINLGSLIPPLITGVLVAKFGWHAGFVAAAIGMTIGQIIFQLGKHQLGTAGLYPKANMDYQPSYRFYTLLFSGILAAIGLCQLAFRYPEMTTYMVITAAVLVFFVVLFFLFKEEIVARKKMCAALILIVISVAFWSLYNQAFTSLMLYADRNMGKSILGIPLDAEATQFFNPFFIIILSPILSKFWIRMDKVSLNPSTQMKFFLGVFFMSAGYLVLAFGTHFFGVDGVNSPWWLCSSYFFQTVGELLISPIGLAMITVLSPKKLVGMMMGVWFFAQAASFAIGGYLANVAAMPGNVSAAESLPIYSHAFTIYGCIALVMALASFACVPLLNRLVR